MLIFHSYVSLPEGNQPPLMGLQASDDWWSLSFFEGEQHHGESWKQNWYLFLILKYTHEEQAMRFIHVRDQQF